MGFLKKKVKKVDRKLSSLLSLKERLFIVFTQLGLRFGYVLMILPQVHLRKPCYDFSFL